MPLPRFDRLPAEARASVLAVARDHFARDGYDGASYNRIIAELGFSKTTAYHYFDGKGDLFAAVVADSAGRVRAVLGEWGEAADVDAFWARFAAVNRALVAHFASHPDDRAVLAQARPSQDASSWTTALVVDAIRLGLVADGPPELMVAATQGVIDAVDAYALARPAEADRVAAHLPGLLRGLWSESVH